MKDFLPGALVSLLVISFMYGAIAVHEVGKIKQRLDKLEITVELLRLKNGQTQRH
jgi:hypothetical protein